MSDQYAHPQPDDPRAWGTAQPSAPSPGVPPQEGAAQPGAPQPAVPQAQLPQPGVPAVQQPPAAAPQPLAAQQAWVAGYEPGNPWQAQLCMQTQYGTVAYPLTPHTMPELLESLVLVAQEQQGLPVGFDGQGATGAPAAEQPQGPDDEQTDGAGTTLHDGRAARLTGWAVVHDLWEREDPKARIIMGAVVIALLVLGVFLA